MIRSAYIHVPFCSAICSYCAFYRQKDRDHADWLERLTGQIRAKIGDSHPPLETIYFGGGTPSLLKEEELCEILELLPRNAETEISLEANPESVTEEKVRAWKALGINRISLGIQTFSNERLKVMNRRHTAEEAQRAAQTIQKHIPNVSVDLMYGLPGQTLEQLRSDLDRFLGLDVPHVSIYSLQIEENSVWGKQKVQPMEDELEADMYEAICDCLKAAGYDHYEISSFAREGRYSRHNLVYWQDQDWYGFGPGAAGREGSRRYRIGSDWAEREEVCDRPFEVLMMGLRTRFGVDVADYQNRYGINLLEKHAAAIQKWVCHFHVEEGRLFLDEAGRELLNAILLDFME